MDLIDNITPKTLFVKDIKENQKVIGTFLVKRKNIGRTKAGKPYLSLTLCDKTGEIPGRVWEQAVTLDHSFQKDDFIEIEAIAVTYQNVLQLSISSLTPCSPSEIDITDFLPQAQRDREETFAELISITNKVGNSHLKKLLDLFFTDE